MMLTVLFREVEVDLHKKVKSESTIVEVPIYKIYNNAMDSYSTKLKYNRFPVHIRNKSMYDYKGIRVKKIDSEIYKKFKITCIQKDISVSQGINLALASWLKSTSNDHSNLENKE